MSSKVVKLNVYQHLSEEIVVDVFEAKDWGDFVIVKIKGVDIRPESHDAMMAVFDDYHKQSGKTIILVAEGADIEFFGVEVDDESDDD